MKLMCWWFGCWLHDQDPSPIDEATCARCGHAIGYADLVGDSRHARLMRGLTNAMRRIWPAKCGDCGRRWRKHDQSMVLVHFARDAVTR